MSFFRISMLLPIEKIIPANDEQQAKRIAEAIARDAEKVTGVKGVLRKIESIDLSQVSTAEDQPTPPPLAA